MSRRWVPFVIAVVLVGATSPLLVSPLLAGDVEHAPDARPTTRYPLLSTPVVHVVPVVFSLVVTIVPQPAIGQTQVALRGPNGQLRRFPVEGGLDAIQYQQIVLRPGQSVTIQWVATKRRSLSLIHI